MMAERHAAERRIIALTLIALAAAGAFALNTGGAEILTECLLIALLHISLRLAAGLADGWMRLALLLLAAAALVLGLADVHPAFVLPLPITVYEIAARIFRTSWSIPVALAVPFPALPDGWLVPYGIAAAASYACLRAYDADARRIRMLLDEREQLRRKLRQTSLKLGEMEGYLRQSEYVLKLEERSRISQRLHDEIGQSLTGALMQMEAARRLFGADQTKAEQLLQQAIRIAKEGIDRIRMTLKQWKPLPEQLGFHRLKRLAAEFEAQHSIRVSLTHEGDLHRILPIHWKIIYDNAAEALTNVLKYAAASRVDIHVQVMRAMIRSVVADDGQGAARIVKGLGLAGMEERAASAGGTVIVDGSRGFVVTTLLPLDIHDAGRRDS
jgi:Signal transduction histidine kinase